MGQLLLAIVGPTATGKTEVGMLVAEALGGPSTGSGSPLSPAQGSPRPASPPTGRRAGWAEPRGGEILSADSMQVYRAMDIGTAKPSAAQRARVPHHLIDIVDPEEAFSVAEYRDRADAALAGIWERGRQPILVGGSGLYVRAVLEEMDFSEVEPDAALRQRLKDEAATKGLRVLHQRLAEVDPEAARRIHPNDEKRIIRALEVAEAGGRRPRPVDQARATRYNTRQFGLTVSRAELYRRIEARVDAMVGAGLIDEVRGLLARGCRPELVSMKGLGYAQMVPYLRGEAPLEEAVRRLKRDTRRFAKRQLTWFRADPRIRWIDVEQAGGPPGAAETVVEEWRSG